MDYLSIKHSISCKARIISISVEVISSSLITREELQEFKEIYHREYGVVLDDKTATYKAEKLLLLIRSVYKPIKKSDLQLT